ncbi:MAG: hypothetical protein GY868_13355 [Deltaproteobacteria bacterium]|nr:hypothetical protein [Deltaproteobacteria bacterium]
MESDIKKTVDDLNRRLLALDQHFTQYFNGRSNKPPVQELEKLKHAVTKLTEVKNRTSAYAQRFMATSFTQRFMTYQHKWEQCLLDIEKGRQERHSRRE